MSLDAALELLNESVIHFRGEPVGTAAACDPDPVAANYTECFVRDFVPSALVFLMRGEPAIVRNFLTTVMQLRGQQPVLEGHVRSRGLMPASFHVKVDDDGETLEADFGERAIGRVIPVDSAMWWMFLLRAYVATTGDWDYVKDAEVQTCMREILDLYLRERFESVPTLLVPDGSFMIDRRMGVYGHPLEIQALFYGMLLSARQLLSCSDPERPILENLDIRIRDLRSYVRRHYWVDRERLNEIHRFQAEEFGVDATNVLNVYPESIPDWMDGWLDMHAGYLVGNQGPGRVDFRFFTQGNLLAILFDLATPAESSQIMSLFELHWDEVIGEMPLKITYPAMTGREWMLLTGSDPKNVPWSYHNGGNWPVLIWPFVGAAMRTGRTDMAERALALFDERLAADKWPEYYDGKRGGLIGRRANYYQVWSVTGYIVAREILRKQACRTLFDRCTRVDLDAVHCPDIP
ncbi:MAG: glycoside hydrolase 100 family protein [Thiohalobacterales bacterium]|nr:glycoside hydrolase 100 family protein [Thiohalobacterales bacterium]